jgi:L,D-peptidoglycan transpeptidase YkuD (ErfK/YbiS/YcfS/YnhG family)
MRKTFVSVALAISFVVFTGADPAHAKQFAWLDSVSTSNQVVLVTASNSASTTGTLRTFEKANGQWNQVQSAMPVFLGRAGLVPAAARVQSSGKTPIGTFALTSAFGRKANPGTLIPYTQIDRDDAWTYNPKIPSTYNLFQSVNRSWATYGRYVEHLWKLGPQYDYVLTTSFNQPIGEIVQGSDGINRANPSADTRRGGGIFFHVSKGIPTAGCISMNKNAMRSLLQWLKPESHPIAMIGLAKNFS